MNKCRRFQTFPGKLVIYTHFVLSIRPSDGNCKMKIFFPGTQPGIKFLTVEQWNILKWRLQFFTLIKKRDQLVTCLINKIMKNNGLTGAAPKYDFLHQNNL